MVCISNIFSFSLTLVHESKLVDLRGHKVAYIVSVYSLQSTGKFFFYKNISFNNVEFLNLIRVSSANVFHSCSNITLHLLFYM